MSRIDAYDIPFAAGDRTKWFGEAQPGEVGHALDQLAKRLPVVVVKSADQTINSQTTMQDDDELLLPFLAGESALVTIAATFISPAAADIKMGFTFPSGVLHLVGHMRRDDGAGDSGVYFSTSAEELSMATTGFGSLMVAHGIYRCGSTAGSLQFTWAQNTSNGGDTTFKADSAIWKQRYA